MRFYQLFILLLSIQITLYAAPFRGQEFTYFQPDSTPFQVKLFGDEFYAEAETTAGYTIGRDPTSAWFVYVAGIDDDGEYILCKTPAHQPVPQGIVKNLRRSAERRRVIQASDPLIQSSQDQLRGPSTPIIGKRVGLTLLVKFPDRPQDVTISQDQVDAFCNDEVYNEFYNASSVYKYFEIQSNGKLHYRNVVTAYFTAQNNRDYYTDRDIYISARAKELVNEGLAVLAEQGFDFSQCDGDGDGKIDGINVFYAGARVNSWREGLWPHQSGSSSMILYDHGLSSSYSYQITNMGQELSIGTFCHENGHMICRFPDLYPYNESKADTKEFCLMSSAAALHPPNISAYLKIQAGWAEAIDLDIHSNLRGLLAVDRNFFYRFKHPTDPNQYFLLETRNGVGYEGPYVNGNSIATPAEGLVIYQCNESGSNMWSTLRPDNSITQNYQTPYELMVIEALPIEGYSPWYIHPQPGSGDAFFAYYRDQISDSSLPNALKFWGDGGRETPSGMAIQNISEAWLDTNKGRTFLEAMTFEMGAPPNTFILNTTATAIDFNMGPAVPIKTYDLFVNNGGTLNADVSVTTNAPWLSLSEEMIYVDATPQKLILSFNSENLVPGIYTANLTFTPSLEIAATTIPITLTVLEAATLTTSPSRIELYDTITPQNISLRLENVGDFPTHYTITDSVNWLTPQINSGKISVESDQLDFVLDTQYLSPGFYTTEIIITPDAAGAVPLHVPISLTIPNENTGYFNRLPAAFTDINGGELYNFSWIYEPNTSNLLVIVAVNQTTAEETLVGTPTQSGTGQFLIPTVTEPTTFYIQLQQANGAVVDQISLTAWPSESFPPPGNFSNRWQGLSNTGWALVQGLGSEGSLYLQSPPLGDNQSSTFSYTGQFITGQVSFDYYTDCDYDDELIFAINGTIQQRWSGPQSGWRSVVFPISSGLQTLTWTYKKDSRRSLGSDHVRIDRINLPLQQWEVAFSVINQGTLEGEATQWVKDGFNTSPIRAIPHPKGGFIEWNGDLTTSVNPLQILEVNQPYLINAEFELLTYRVEFLTGQNGAITSGEAVQTVPAGGSAELPSIQANAGWAFSGWDKATTNVHDDLQVFANFVQLETQTIQYTLAPGWNIISLLDDRLPQELLVNNQNQRLYSGLAYLWDTTKSFYRPLESAQSGLAVWVYSENGGTSMPHELPIIESITVQSEVGWNLFGVPWSSFIPNFSEAIYLHKNGKYHSFSPNSEPLPPLEGFWIHTEAPTTIEFIP